MESIKIKEQRVLLRRVGLIDPESIEEFVQHDGYRALEKALTSMTPAEIREEVKASSLRGRGGAGFPAGLKWGFVSSAESPIKYVICNADESEPGTFKDRIIMENDPHSIIEAMTIAGFAVGAQEGYIYIRGEYHLSQQRMTKAVEQANEAGYLGKNILDSGFDFNIHIHAGAGAYICGEETALIEAIEGKRGEPRTRPPFPTTYGLRGKPSLVNNVETFANVPPIILNGAEWYKGIGTANSAGTKIYTILGNVNKVGYIEVPLGITTREIIDDFAGGMKDGATFKLAQTGGSSGTVIPPSLLDVPLDFDAMKEYGVSLGSGAMLICDEHTCVVDLSIVLLNFFRNESCGKCAPCRIGTQRGYETFVKISQGKGTIKDISLLEYFAANMKALSNCGLGNTACAPISGILEYFKAEIIAHIEDHSCPAGVCKFEALQ
ncbi:MAG: NADH-quinone oxidoreductase subunit NuoF [Anaerolineales bacterium]|nr:NADH-quinone oxidoreductase subunit NuoF [Anaerolineales bacterium]